MINDVENVHKDHRMRMKRRFFVNGLENFSQHEIIEMLLFYAIPRVNTNETAHRLIKKFGSVQAIFSASCSELLEVRGIGKESAIFLKLLGDVFRIYNKPAASSEEFMFSERSTYFMNKIGWIKDKEVFMAAGINSEMKAVSCEVIEIGTPGEVQIDLYKLAKFMVNSNCSHVVLAHNHPEGNEEPSYADFQETERIQDFLKMIHVNLLDHIIVGKNVYSMHEHNLM